MNFQSSVTNMLTNGKVTTTLRNATFYFAFLKHNLNRTITFANLVVAGVAKSRRNMAVSLNFIKIDPTKFYAEVSLFQLLLAHRRDSQ